MLSSRDATLRSSLVPPPAGRSNGSFVRWHGRSAATAEVVAKRGWSGAVKCAGAAGAIFAASLGSLVAGAAETAPPAPTFWQNIQIGGFVSQGYLLSSANDYLGNTSQGTFDFREYALNASYAQGRWRIGAQAFGQKLGDYGNDRIKLDWATIDYQAAQWFGVRAGRVKMPRGLYNEALDVDSVRPFVLLPQSIYDNRLRDFNASFDGAMIYGNVPLKRFGSLDYTLYGGDTPMKPDSGAADFFTTETAFENLAIGISSLAGGTLFWNTPVKGLRAGYSHTTYRKLTVLQHIVIPAIFLDVVGAKSARVYRHHQVSVEYACGDWVFAAEVARDSVRYAVGQFQEFFVEGKSDASYVSVARRLNHWLELGTYYSVTREHYRHDTSAPLPPLLEQNDFAVSARFDVSDRVIFKVEGHAMDGTGKIFDTASQPNPPAGRDRTWSMVAAKITVSF